MGVSSGSYFFTRINRIRSIVELKFYIRVQEEDIRVQEEFVNEDYVSQERTQGHNQGSL